MMPLHARTLLIAAVIGLPASALAQTNTLTGTAAYGDWRGDAPGVRGPAVASTLSIAASKSSGAAFLLI